MAGVLFCPACALSSGFCPLGVGFCPSGACEAGALQSGRGGVGGGAACCARAQVTETQKSMAPSRKASNILSIIFITVIIETPAAQRQSRQAQHSLLDLILLCKTPALGEAVPGIPFFFLTADAKTQSARHEGNFVRAPAVFCSPPFPGAELHKPYRPQPDTPARKNARGSGVFSP